jgi:hypothetical protein
MLMAKPLADSSAVVPAPPAGPAGIARWREGVRERAGAALESFIRTQCDEYVRGFPGSSCTPACSGAWRTGCRS